MQLNLNSMMKNFGFNKILPIYIKENRSVNYLLIRPDLYDLNKLMLSLHLSDRNIDFDKIDKILFETNYKMEFDNIKEDLENLFFYLTEKNIDLEFKKGDERRFYQHQLFSSNQNFLLFSGGLDSLCGLAQLRKKGMVYPTHIITNNTILGIIRQILSQLRPLNYPIVFLDARTKALVGGPSNTRGLVFFTFACTISKHFEKNEIFFPENGGQILDVMLSPIAYPNKPALKNTNPIFINKLGKILNKFFNEKFNINLMNKNNTKSEMLASTIASIPYQITNSCFTTRGISNMCGICYNCFLRNLSLMSINIFENYYEYDPFIDVINKTDVYDERQRILYHILRFYYEILINDKDAMQEVEISSKGYFDNPIEIANRFGSDIFLGIKNYFEFYEPTNLNALGKKADELLTMIEPEILDKRQQKLSEIAEDI